MDFSTFIQAMVKGVPLLFVVMGLVQWVKTLPNFNTKATPYVSMAIGVVLGGLWMLTQERPPAGDWYISLVYWFGVVVYGLAIGICASGLYDVAVDAVTKMLKKTNG